MTTVQTPTVEREIRIDAKPETVFPFLIDAEKMIHWIGTATTLDARPGGELDILVGGDKRVSGEFLEIDPPHRVVFTWGWHNADIGLPPGSSRVEISLLPDAGGTLVRLRHLDLPESLVADHTEGWTHLLGALAKAVTEALGAAR